LLGHPVSGEDYALVNRDLFYEFAALLSTAKWDVALLQEVPVRWGERLAEATGSQGRISLTARNWMRPLTWPLARSRPHLTGSWEGGCNLILVRKGRPGAEVVDHRRAVLARLPERRVVSMITTHAGLCVANLHASTGSGAEDDVVEAARLVAGWAGDRPLVLGGDFNARPRSSGLFDRLAGEFGLSAPTEPGSIDHLLVRGAEILEPAASWPPERRDVPDPETGLKIRLSDHGPVLSRISA
jgi:endonuclease/exonuclease/phosphatase family metal-dependent hydrolase